MKAKQKPDSQRASRTSERMVLLFFRRAMQINYNLLIKEGFVMMGRWKKLTNGERVPYTLRNGFLELPE